MQVTHPHLLGDLGDQILPAELKLGIRGPVDDHTGRLEAEGIYLPAFEYAGSAELMEELMELTMVSPRTDGWMRNELGPGRFSRLMKLWFRVWLTERMI